MKKPAWILPGAKYDLDFRNLRYFGGYVYNIPNDNRRRGTLLYGQTGFSGSTRFGAIRPDGKVQIFGDGQLRIVPGQGLWAEANTTNYALHSRDLTQTAWVKTDVTATRDQPGNDINDTANTGTRLTFTADNGTCLQSITLASGTRITSAFVKRITGTGTIEMTQDGGINWTDITSLINSNTYTRVNVASATITNPQVGFRGANGQEIAVDFFQTENYGFPTSPIVTTSSTLARGAEQPQFGHASTDKYNAGLSLINLLHSNRPLSIVVEVVGKFNPSGDALLKGGGSLARGRIGVLSDGRAYGGTQTRGTLPISTNTVNNGGLNRVAMKMDGLGTRLCLNGGGVASGTGMPPAPATDDHMSLGNNGAGLLPLNGYVRRVTFIPRSLTDAQLIAYSKV